MDSENQLGKPFGAAPPEDSQAKPGVGSENSAAGTTIQRLFPEMRRPKPNQEAIAAALQAMQRLTMKMDSESAAEESAPQTAGTAFIICSSCGHKNREANKFCGMCGLPVEASPDESPASGLPQFELPNFGLPVPASAGFEDERPPSRIPDRAQEAEREVHPDPGAAGQHHYHHHYHHHYFQGGVEGGSAREGMHRKALAKPTA